MKGTKKMATTAVVKKEENAVALTAMNTAEMEAWGSDVSDSTELLIPKAILMQAVSELVQDRTCSSGDIIRSTDKKILFDSSDDKPLLIIPFSMTRTWLENKYDDGMYRWDHERPWTAENANDPWEYELNGEKWKRQKAYNFYALLRDETDPTALPIIKLQFKSGSIKAGKVLADFFARLQLTNRARKAAGKTMLVPACNQWKLSSKMMEGDKNKYQAFVVEMGPETPKELIEQAATWYMMMKTQPQNIKEHEVKESSEAEVVTEMDTF
jgi:hypothetical protein